MLVQIQLSYSEQYVADLAPSELGQLAAIIGKFARIQYHYSGSSVESVMLHEERRPLQVAIDLTLMRPDLEIKPCAPPLDAPATTTED